MNQAELIEDFIKQYGHLLPDPQHCPKEFEYYVILYKYFKGLL